MLEPEGRQTNRLPPTSIFLSLFLKGPETVLLEKNVLTHNANQRRSPAV